MSTIPTKVSSNPCTVSMTIPKRKLPKGVLEILKEQSTFIKATPITDIAYR